MLVSGGSRCCSDRSVPTTQVGKSMFGFILFIGAAFVASGFLTMVVTMFRPIQVNGGNGSSRIWVSLFIACSVLPYIFFETQTALFGAAMKEAVQEAIDDEGIDGQYVFYKVLGYTGSTAHVLAIAEEPSTWGGMDRPAVRMTLQRAGDKWSLAESHVVYSDNRNQDGVVFPPYW